MYVVFFLEADDLTFLSQYGIFVNLTDRLEGNRRRRITWTSSRPWLTRSVTVVGMRTPSTSSPATTVPTKSRTAITRSGSKRCERDFMCVLVKFQQLLYFIFLFFFFFCLHFYWNKFCFINRNCFFLVKLLFVSIVWYNRNIVRPFPSSLLSWRKMPRDVPIVFGRLKDFD